MVRLRAMQSLCGMAEGGGEMSGYCEQCENWKDTLDCCESQLQEARKIIPELKKELEAARKICGYIAAKSNMHPVLRQLFDEWYKLRHDA